MSDKVSKKVTTLELEVAVVNHFRPLVNLIIPNVKWGWGLHYEADLVVLTESDYAYEVELKVTKSDLKQDAKKRHTHNDPLFRGLWFAMPEEIIDAGLIPVKAGILSYYLKDNPGVPGQKYRKIKVLRRPATIKDRDKIGEPARAKLRSLAYFRMWKAKRDLLEEKKKCANLEEKLKDLRKSAGI